MLLFVLFYLLTSVSLADPPTALPSGPPLPEPRVVQTVVSSADQAQVLELGGHQYVSYQGTRTIDYDTVAVVKFVDGDLLFRAKRGKLEYFTLSVFALEGSKLFVMADLPSNNLYLDWREQLHNCYPLLGVVSMVDGTTHYVAFEVNQPLIKTFERLGPRVTFTAQPSHVCWVGETGLVLLRVEPAADSMLVEAWYAL